MIHPFDGEAFGVEKLRQLVGLVGNKSDPQFGSDLVYFFFLLNRSSLGWGRKGCIIDLEMTLFSLIEMAIFNLPPEILMSCNQALIFENLFFNFVVGSMQLDS